MGWTGMQSLWFNVQWIFVIKYFNIWLLGIYSKAMMHKWIFGQDHCIDMLKRIPMRFSLHFSEFYVNFYKFRKFNWILWILNQKNEFRNWENGWTIACRLLAHDRSARRPAAYSAWAKHGSDGRSRPMPTRCVGAEAVHGHHALGQHGGTLVVGSTVDNVYPNKWFKHVCVKGNVSGMVVERGTHRGDSSMVGGGGLERWWQIAFRRGTSATVGRCISGELL
jgi:hypothetical protein